MGTTYTLTGDLSNQLGDDLKSVYAYVRTNLPSGTALIDTTVTAGSVRLGTGKIDVASNGTFSVTLLGTANTGLNVEPNTLRYEVVVEYTDIGARQKMVWRSGFFELTANTDLKDVAPNAEAIAIASASSYALEAKGYRDEAATISGLTGEDAAVAFLVDEEGSATARAVSSTITANVTGTSDLAVTYTYTREDMGVSILGRDDTTGRLYGVSFANGHFVTSDDDGDTWTDRTYSPSVVAPGITEIIRIGAFMFGPSSTTGKVWRAPLDVFNGWVDITPAGMPTGTTGRPGVLSTDGTRLLYGNYNAASGTTEHARVWRTTDPTATTPTWAQVLEVTDARHVHAVKPDPRTAGAWWVSLGDAAQPGNGIYYSTDNGATFTRVSKNRYPINLAFPPSPTDTDLPSWVIGEGDGIDQPHLFAFRRSLLPTGGPQEGLAWPATEWKGTARGLHIDANGDAFWISTAEGGAVGTQDGVWAARGPYYASPVLLEALSSPWAAYLQTYESGDYLFNFRYRIKKPTWKPRTVTKASPTHTAPGLVREGQQAPIPSRVTSTSGPHEYPLGMTSGLVSGGSWPVEGILHTQRTTIRATQMLVSVNTTLDFVPSVWVRNTYRPAGSDPLWGAWRHMGPGLVGAYASGSVQTIANSTQTLVSVAGVRHAVGGITIGSGAMTIPSAGAGYYQITGQVAWAAAAVTTGRREVTVRRNGTALALTRHPGTTDVQTTAVNTTQLLAAGDVIDLYAFQTSGAALDTRAGGTETFLDIRRIAVG